jgi:hypothetical protein
MKDERFLEEANTCSTLFVLWHCGSAKFFADYYVQTSESEGEKIPSFDSRILIAKFFHSRKDAQYVQRKLYMYNLEVKQITVVTKG